MKKSPDAAPATEAQRCAFATVRSQLLLRDAHRLSRQLGGRRLDAARFERDVQKALLAAENRQRLRPTRIAYPDDLPVVQAKDDILAALRDHPVIVLCGETGSGKTTQLPKLCLELGRGRHGLIGHTQPRRLAARSVANRIAQELQTPVGQLVGFETRFDRRVGEQSLIKLMTDGILLAELQRDRELLAYDTLIIDEAHERSLNIDFLLGWLRQLLPRRPDLKLIITSATLDPERLSRHFGDCPILRVEGRTYPVETRYRPPDADGDLDTAVADAVAECWRGGARGDVLVFLPGEREINDLARSLPGRFPRAEVMPLYSRLPAAQQDRVFSPGGAPRVVLSTNVAETSITVPGIRYVVDLGTARISRFSARLGVQQLHIEPVAQSAANQRAGRCGRVGPGVCIRLYEEADFLGRAPFTDPEILRANLAGVILQMTALGLGDVERFPWVDAPDHRLITDAYRLLQTLGALDEHRRLTPQGREIARLPLDPRIARIALAGRETATPHAVWVLAAALSVQDPHEVPPDQTTQARQQHARWRHARSDFLTLLQLWQRWQDEAAGLNQRQQRKWCKAHYVNYLRMTEWSQVYQQVADFLARDDGGRRPVWQALAPEDIERLSPTLHQALLAGLIDHIGLKRPEAPEFQGPRGRKFHIFPGSVLARKPPQWVMSAQLVQTSRLFARTNAMVDPAWLERVGAHLLKRTLQHPEWDPERGEVTSTEHVSLFGLPLARRQRHYGSAHPREARAIFIEEALVGGRLLKKPRVLLQNLARIEAVREKEARLRRPDLLVTDAQLFARYDERLPEDVCTDAALRRWLQMGGAAKLALSEDELLRPGASTDVGDQFPDHIDVGGVRLRLQYTHDPSEDADGVSFLIPQAQLFSLPAAAFDWLVPGLHAALVEGLIRTLPQKQRRYCTPAAEYARAVLEAAGPTDGPVREVICRELKRMTGLDLGVDDFDPERLPAHLRPRLVLVDARGRALGDADSLAGLQQQHRAPARAALQKAAVADDATRAWTRDDLQDWDFDALPDAIRLASGAAAHPALQAHVDGVRLRLFEDAASAHRAHRDGVRALLLAHMSDRLRDLRKTAKSRLGTHLVGRPYDAEALADSLARRAANDILLDPVPRDRASWQTALEKRGQFSRYALDLLGDVVDWMQTATTLRRSLRGAVSVHGHAVADIQAQLDQLFAPGFIERLPEDTWLRIPVYLKAIQVRLERLPLKPARDIELTAQLRPLVARLPAAFHPAQWIIEEWRIAAFAQALRAQGSPTPEKIVAALAP